MAAVDQQYVPEGERELRKLDEAIQYLVAGRHFTLYNLGGFLGLESSPEAEARSEYRAARLLQVLGFLPTHSDIVLCEETLLDAAGNILVDNQGNEEKCGNVMNVNSDRSRRLGFRWRCRGSHFFPGTRILNRDMSHRDVRISALTNTILGDAKFPFKDFLKILALFLNKGKVTDSVALGFSDPTGIDWFQRVRESLAVAGWHDQGKIGGPGDVVEIDEVRLFRRKNNQGRIPIGDHWVFGGTSRATKRKFAMRVDRRDMRTLHAEIIDSVANGSILCTDGWRAYNRLLRLRDANGQLRYRDHLVVIHETNFLNPPRGEDPFWRNDILYECRDRQHVGAVPQAYANAYPAYLPFRAHTQSIERSWRELRKQVRSSRDFPTVDMYIGSYLYNANVLMVEEGGMLKLRRVLRDIKRVYPGPNQQPIRANRPYTRLYPTARNVQLCACDECENM